MLHQPSQVSYITFSLFLIYDAHHFPMNRLPQEVLDPIIEYFMEDFEQSRREGTCRFHRKLSDYSRLSRGWQHAIEARIFQKFHVKGSKELPRFTALLQGPRNEHRRAAVKSITFRADLPAPFLEEMTNYVNNRRRELLTEFKHLLTMINGIWVSNP